MPRHRRHRASSTGSYQDGALGHLAAADTSRTLSRSSTVTMDADLDTARRLMNSLLYLRDDQGRGFLHHPFNLSIAKCLLERCRELEDATHKISWQSRFLLQPDLESGYTPFHRAVVRGDLAAMLLFLRGPGTDRFLQRPMTLLHAASVDFAKALDHEGLTPLALLGKWQISELGRCRQHLQSLVHQVRNSGPYLARRSLVSSENQYDDQDEMEELRSNLDVLLVEDNEGESAWPCHQQESNPNDVSYGCEVVTFGRPHHCALGVISSGNTTGGGGNIHSLDAADPAASATFFPQRVQEFAQERVLREGSALVASAATHHTLIACRNGHAYAFGLNRGGRLGLGDDCPQQCPLPRRILGAFKSRHVIAVSAAENHSLAVTSDGIVWAWGSNRFGQLGGDFPSATNEPFGNQVNTSRSVPRRVEELKQIRCVSVAAGERHSVALSRDGEVYVWGDNTAGQCGVPRRNGLQKVQRVDALWSSNASGAVAHGRSAQLGSHGSRKIAIAIAAAEHSTLVLTNPVPGLTQVNSVYAWGHGNHVPSRVHFETPSNGYAVDPVSIACAKHHNAATTRNGQVYTWGLHRESLGRSNNNNPNHATANNKPSPSGKSRNMSSGRAISSPQLVTGMLPEHGGGFAVAVSASEQHTAVVTDCGALFTWGTTHGKNVLGHEGVRWQPDPKRVPGVHRAVNVAVAKEHSVLLIGTSFPPIQPASDALPTLEDLSARKIAEYVDLFNVVPVFIMAGRTECRFLVDYCAEFIRRNLDGVLNVGKKSVLNQYLNDMLADSLHCPEKQYRDDNEHPFVADVVTAGNQGKPTFDREWFASKEEWIRGCKELSESPVVQRILDMAADREHTEELDHTMNGRRRSSSISSNPTPTPTGRTRSDSCAAELDTGATSKVGARVNVLDSCIKKTATMDLSTPALAREQLVWLGKELRGVQKKLNQVAKLEESKGGATLTSEERAKIDRRPTLEAQRTVYQTAIEQVESRIKELSLEARKETKISPVEERKGDKATKQKQLDSQALKCEDKDGKDEPKTEQATETVFVCGICGIKCPDKRSYDLHNNGRKHRNRVAQVAEEEKEQAAKQIMKQNQVSLMFSPTHSSPTAAKPKSAWGTASAQPKFSLPPPPHPVVAHVTPTALVAPSNLSVAVKKSTKSPLAPSPRSFKTILREQEATKTPPLNRQAPETPKLKPSPTPRVRVPNVSSPVAAASPHQQAIRGARGSCSLADFLSPPRASTTGGSKSAKGWLMPGASTRLDQTSPGKSLAEIQAEELDFQGRQDQAYGKSGGSWYVERKERAGSLQEIQQAAERERVFQCQVEEQRQIEAEIQRELQEKSSQNKSAKKKNAKPKASPKNKGKQKQGDPKQEGEPKEAGERKKNSRKNNHRRPRKNKASQGTSSQPDSMGKKS